jgi:predicted nucleic acid-binding protein
MTDATPYFVDTAYIQAVINTRDQWHGAAARWEAWPAAERRRLVTTEFVLIEFGDSLATVKARSLAAGMIDVLRGSSLVDTVPTSAELFDAALGLYRNRADKGWGLTDCSSFVVMRERGLTAALTADEHFRQAGFRALLLDAPSG